MRKIDFIMIIILIASVFVACQKEDDVEVIGEPYAIGLRLKDDNGFDKFIGFHNSPEFIGKYIGDTLTLKAGKRYYNGCTGGHFYELSQDRVVTVTDYCK